IWEAAFDFPNGGRWPLLLPDGLKPRQFGLPGRALGSGDVDAAGAPRPVPGLLDVAEVTGILLHRLGHVLEQLSDHYLAVAVAVACAFDALDQVIGEEAMAQPVGLERLLALTAGGQEEPALTCDLFDGRRTQPHVTGEVADRHPRTRINLPRVAA